MSENNKETKENINETMNDFSEFIDSAKKKLVDVVKSMTENEEVDVLKTQKESMTKQDILKKLSNGIKNSINSLKSMISNISISTFLLDIKYVFENAFILVFAKVTSSLKNLIMKNSVAAKFTEIITSPFAVLMTLMFAAVKLLPETTKALIEGTGKYMKENFPKTYLIFSTLADLLDDVTYWFATTYKGIAEGLAKVGINLPTEWADARIAERGGKDLAEYNKALSQYKEALKNGVNPLGTTEQQSSFEDFMNDKSMLSDTEKNSFTTKTDIGSKSKQLNLVGSGLFGSSTVTPAFLDKLTAKETLALLTKDGVNHNDFDDASRKLIIEAFIKKSKKEKTDVSGILANVTPGGKILDVPQYHNEFLNYGEAVPSSTLKAPSNLGQLKDALNKKELEVDPSKNLFDNKIPSPKSKIKGKSKDNTQAYNDIENISTEKYASADSFSHINLGSTPAETNDDVNPSSLQTSFKVARSSGSDLKTNIG